MASLQLTPITPSRPITDAHTAQKIELLLRQWAGRVQAREQAYPAQRPPKGKRKPYRRTGTLGRQWRITFVPGSATVSNPTSYAGYVEGYTKGPKGEQQVSAAAAIGWPRIDVTGQQEWDAIVGRIMAVLEQRDR